MSDSEDPQFKNWLTARMNAANLTQAERQEFDSWLASKARDANLFDDDE